MTYFKKFLEQIRHLYNSTETKEIEKVLDKQYEKKVMAEMKARIAKIDEETEMLKKIRFKLEKGMDLTTKERKIIRI